MIQVTWLGVFPAMHGSMSKGTVKKYQLINVWLKRNLNFFLILLGGNQKHFWVGQKVTCQKKIKGRVGTVKVVWKKELLKNSHSNPVPKIWSDDTTFFFLLEMPLSWARKFSTSSYRMHQKPLLSDNFKVKDKDNFEKKLLISNHYSLKK